MRRTGARFVLATPLLLAACVGVGGLSGGGEQDGGDDAGGTSETGTNGDGGGDTDANGGDSGCPTDMVVSGTATKYCIDTTEVTNSAYNEFLTTSPSPMGEPADCAWKTSYLPSNTGSATAPVHSVDWCDARKYCASVGKRLCGAIGGASLASLPSTTTTLSQWFTACSNGGMVDYPYGSAFVADACWNASYPYDGGLPTGPKPVRSLEKCVGGVPGLYDMSGNVAEWQDACVDGGSRRMDYCALTGGSYGELAANVRCDSRSQYPRETRVPFIGFRCCKDL